MNEHGEGRRIIVSGRKKVDGPSRGGTKGETKFGIMCRRAIGGAFALPTRKNLWMLGHAGTIVVFDFVVDGHAVSLGNTFGISLVAGKGPTLRRAETALCLAMNIERKPMRKALRQWR
jgi:hypothetical protein